ncbi:MAG: hypothetical protein U1A78_35795 [Polyangia bacterium]
MFRLCASVLLLLLLLSATAVAETAAEPPPASAQGPSAEPEPEPEPEPAPSSPSSLAAAAESPLIQSDGADGSLTLKEATERGIRLFKEGNYDGAIQSFTAAYVLSPKPMFLFNIA